MEDSNKLFVFERKEVILIFIFVVLIAATAFTLGVKVGKKVEVKTLSELPSDKPSSAALDLKSDVEEDMQKIIESKPDDILADVPQKPRDDLDVLESKFKDVVSSDSDLINTQDTRKDVDKQDEAVVIKRSPEEAPTEAKRELSGKYTIQLVSEKSADLASEFAEPFNAAGYDVIINKIDIPTKGIWYRVSIGLFDTLEQAKQYKESEVELFQGKDYIIRQFK